VKQEVEMNKFIGKQAYQNTATTAPRIEDPHAAITVCLETLLHNLKILKEMPSNGSELFSKVASKCLTAIYILQSSLDFDKGHTIAENLFKLYEYVKFQVIAKSRKNETSDLDSAVMIISEISDSWKAIK
jgi:flagellar protein FliS